MNSELSQSLIIISGKQFIYEQTMIVNSCSQRSHSGLNVPREAKWMNRLITQHISGWMGGNTSEWIHNNHNERMTWLFQACPFVSEGHVWHLDGAGGSKNNHLKGCFSSTKQLCTMDHTSPLSVPSLVRSIHHVSVWQWLTSYLNSWTVSYGRNLSVFPPFLTNMSVRPHKHQAVSTCSSPSSHGLWQHSGALLQSPEESPSGPIQNPDREMGNNM